MVANDKRISGYMYEYYTPKRKEPDWRCHIGIHSYRGYDKILHTSEGSFTQYHGRCIRCGASTIGNFIRGGVL